VEEPVRRHDCSWGSSGVRRTRHSCTGNDFHIVKLILVDFHLKLRPDSFNSMTKGKQFVCQAVQESNTQLIECSPGMVTFKAHHCKLVGGAVKTVFVLALGWDSTNFLRATKKSLCFVQKCIQTWGNIAWKQIRDEVYGVLDTKKGEAETELWEGMLWSLDEYLYATGSIRPMIRTTAHMRMSSSHRSVVWHGPVMEANGVSVRSNVTPG